MIGEEQITCISPFLSVCDFHLDVNAFVELNLSATCIHFQENYI